MLQRSIDRQRVRAQPACVAHSRVVLRCQRLRLRVTAAAGSGQDKPQALHTRVAIIGGGPAAHTAAIYAARAELEPILFEGWMAGGLPPGGQLTTTTYVENFPGFVEPILGIDLTDKFRAHSVRYGTRVFTETVTSLDLHVGKDKGQQQGQQQAEGGAHRPFVLYTPERTVTADTVIISTGASAKRLNFPGSGEESDGGFWNRGISACAVCDGTSPLIRNKPVAVVGGGDSAMEEAMYLTRYASKVYLVHRFDYFEASKAMARRALANPKIEVLWRTEVKEAHGNEQGNLGSITVARRGADGQLSHSRLEVGGLFFAIGHRPATDFLDGQLELDPFGHIVTVPGTAVTSVPGVFAAGDVADVRYRQAIVAAGSGCMAALEAERYLQALDVAAPLSAADVASEVEARAPSATASTAA